MSWQGPLRANGRLLGLELRSAATPTDVLEVASRLAASEERARSDRVHGAAGWRPVAARELVPSAVVWGAFVLTFGWCAVSSGANRAAIFGAVTTGWVMSLCLHEFAHAATAYAGGDHGVASRGYLTLNPLRYTNPITSLVVPGLLVAAGGVALPGAAVYIDRSSLRSPKWGLAVDAAGPAANGLCALAAFAPFAVAPHVIESHPSAMWAAAFLGVLETVALFVNLLPLPPFDGFGIFIYHWRLTPAQVRKVRTPRLTMTIIGGLLALSAAGPVGLLWHASYHVGYAAGVPVGVAGEGLDLYRVWHHGPQTPAGLAAVARSSPRRGVPTLPPSGDVIAVATASTTQYTGPGFVAAVTDSPPTHLHAGDVISLKGRSPRGTDISVSFETGDQGAFATGRRYTYIDSDTPAKNPNGPRAWHLRPIAGLQHLQRVVCRADGQHRQRWAPRRD